MADRVIASKIHARKLTNRQAQVLRAIADKRVRSELNHHHEFITDGHRVSAVVMSLSAKALVTFDGLGGVYLNERGLAALAQSSRAD